jgi:hypothetical protein
MNENLREEIIGNNKQMDQKFTDLQALVMKQTSQMAQMMKKMDQFGERIEMVDRK